MDVISDFSCRLLFSLLRAEVPFVVPHAAIAARATAKSDIRKNRIVPLFIVFQQAKVQTFLILCKQ